MRIVAIRERTVSLTNASRNSSIRFDGMTASAVAVHTDAQKDGKPLIGLGFDSIGRYGHGGLLRERFIPRLLAASPCDYDDGDGGIDPTKAWSVMMRDEKFGGHGERSGAVGVLDAAFWDLSAKTAGMPLWAFLADKEGRTADNSIDVYASGGHYRTDDDIGGLRDDINRAGARGYRHFKIKIGGLGISDDITRIDAVLHMLKPGMTLAVDGNGTFSLEQAIGYADALSGYPIRWIEEPVHPLDYDLHRALAERCSIPIATGENLFSADDARNLLRYGGLRPDRDLLQFDVSLSYGLVEYSRILREMENFGWDRRRCVPHAGHLLGMNAVAGLGLGSAEVAMDESTVFGRITTGLSLRDGRAFLPDAPGTGFEDCPAFDELFSGMIN